MPLELLPAEPGDLPRIVQLEDQSFADSPLTPILFPNGKSEESHAAYIKTLLQQWRDNAACRYMKVIDTDLCDRIVAFARWYIFIGNDVEFIKTDPNEQQNVPGCNEEAANEFFGGLLRMRIRILGRKPHCYLSVLCTDPPHQRRGAGAMLTKWGLEIAQKHGVPAFLEASPTGFPLYTKAGFREADKFVLDLGKHGLVGRRTTVLMIKYPEDTPDMVRYGHPDDEQLQA